MAGAMLSNAAYPELKYVYLLKKARPLGAASFKLNINEFEVEGASVSAWQVGCEEGNLPRSTAQSFSLVTTSHCPRHIMSQAGLYTLSWFRNPTFPFSNLGYGKISLSSGEMVFSKWLCWSDFRFPLMRFIQCSRD